MVSYIKNHQDMPLSQGLALTFLYFPNRSIPILTQPYETRTMTEWDDFLSDRGYWIWGETIVSRLNLFISLAIFCFVSITVTRFWLTASFLPKFWLTIEELGCGGEKRRVRSQLQLTYQSSSMCTFELLTTTKSVSRGAHIMAYRMQSADSRLYE